MNCINHPESPVTAYCQNCGKPMCSQCVRSVAGYIYCEPCLAARAGFPGAQPGAPIPPGVPVPAPGPNPGLATLLGFIPGVGAMYNGQFVKALVHVLVFAVLVGIAQDHGIFGLFIAAWVLYQVFDANQTAKARRDGLPLPDPFGLNELGTRLGIHNPVAVPPVAPAPGTQSYASPPNPPAAPFAGETYVPPNPQSHAPASGFVGQTYAPPPPPPPNAPCPPEASMPPMPPLPRRNEPTGAIILIALGLIFLFGTLGVFSFDWIGHGWPLIIIAVGVWLFLKRSRETGGGVQ